MKRTYTAVFRRGHGGSSYIAHVPDLPGCSATGETLELAAARITEAAAARLTEHEDSGLPVPAPTPQHELERGPGCLFSLIHLDTVAHRAMTDTAIVQRIVSLPSWMAWLANERGMDLSQVLREALHRRFNL